MDKKTNSASPPKAKRVGKKSPVKASEKAGKKAPAELQALFPESSVPKQVKKSAKNKPQKGKTKTDKKLKNLLPSEAGDAFFYPDQKSLSKPAAAQKQTVINPAALPLTGVVLDELWQTVLSRKNADPAISHSARLLSKGTLKVAQKFGEEAVECLLEAMTKNTNALIAESADVLYHLTVLWVDAGLQPAQVWDELTRRKNMSGIEEKDSRSKDIPAPLFKTPKIP